MAGTSVCNDTSDAVELFEPQGLYLKPVARLNVCVQLPQLKQPGKSISNWEVMEKIKHMIKPEQFITLKIVKSTLEFLRFEGEIENKSVLKTCIAKLDGKTMKLSGFPDNLKVRSAEAKTNFPTRHNWDSYFRDAKHMNEMKPGERPDTIHLRDLPSRWFSNKKDHNKDKPSEFILKKVFETFGVVRCCDIPMLDPYRKEMATKTAVSSAIQTFSYGQDLQFEAFVQFTEYISFVKAMDAFRGMKLMYKGDDSKALTASVKIDFDKTKHLTDKAIRKRRIEREKLVALEQQREAKVRKEREEEEKKREEERRKREEEDKEKERKREEKERKRIERRKVREEKRRQLREEQRKLEQERRIAVKIAMEERKLLLAQRKLESIRMLEELFNRIKIIKQQEEVVRREKELENERKREVEDEKMRVIDAAKRKIIAEKRKSDRLEKQEKLLRNKILKNLKTIEERKEEKEREDLRQKISGKVRLKSAIVMRK